MFSSFTIWGLLINMRAKVRFFFELRKYFCVLEKIFYVKKLHISKKSSIFAPDFVILRQNFVPKM